MLVNNETRMLFDSLRVFTNEVIQSVFSAMTIYAWDTNWAFTNGETRVQLVSTFNIILFRLS